MTRTERYDMSKTTYFIQQWTCIGHGRHSERCGGLKRTGRERFGRQIFLHVASYVLWIREYILSVVFIVPEKVAVRIVTT